MYRVELKALWLTWKGLSSVQFLMYRVELKAFLRPCLELYRLPVPNVPCGVESIVVNMEGLIFRAVPNVPCGVERVSYGSSSELLGTVPNVPCGVESLLPHTLPRISLPLLFLMYRVELKGTFFIALMYSSPLFLMYRVELKGAWRLLLYIINKMVPNVPCGVERKRSGTR